MISNDADELVELAAYILRQRDDLVIAYDARDPHYTIAVTALALRLRRDPGTAFRALYERWDRVRIVRELF